MSLKQKPDRSVGSVGDKVTVLGRKYEKASNGVWGPVIDKTLLSQIRRAYVDEGLTLRATAARVSDGAHAFSFSVIQNIVNEHGWMRSHYGRKDAAMTYLEKVRKTLFKLYDAEAFSLRDLAHVTGVRVEFVVDLFERHERTHDIGRRPSESRVDASRNLSVEMVRTWNRILGTDANDCDFDEYKKLVRRMTDIVYRKFRRTPKRERSHEAHLDHVLSIRDGYYEMRKGRRVKRVEVVPFSLIAHPLNLRLVTRQVNLLKGDQSLHTAEELRLRVNQHRIQLKSINRKKELRVIASTYKLERYEEN